MAKRKNVSQDVAGMELDAAITAAQVACNNVDQLVNAAGLRKTARRMGRIIVAVGKLADAATRESARNVAKAEFAAKREASIAAKRQRIEARLEKAKTDLAKLEA